MAMKTSHAPLFRLLFWLLFVVGLVGASGQYETGPYIHTPPSGSCRGGIAKQDSSEVLARRSPPCRRPRLQNP
ncbi:unnamed protein product [Brassica rapa]|uniref:Uncharacterized protein n=2 Tax=Brassica TaxID=3705 RepID=A0A3P6CN95_BRACM|nr:unnamed protein product [Brassica napus]CAG7906234.1 unnamed protein product [Brassica rapa]VDD11915.1 unnamed protein product [Brassica rapa]